MLLRIGIIAMSFSIVLAFAVVAIFNLRDGSEKVVAAEAAVASSESTTEQAYQDPRDKMLDLPARKAGLQSEQQSRNSGSAPNPEDRKSPSSSGAGAQPEAGQDRNSLPLLADSDWPVPDDDEIKQASQPRHYDWAPGAVLALTVESMGIYSAPVMNSDSQQALDNGVIHVPGTSMPWTRSPQRNVYLAGHRLGWPGTGSRLIFYNLNKLKSGDEVILRDRRDRIYRYRVSNIFVVGPNDNWVTGQIRNRDMVTLQSCTGPNFSKRLIVRADRV